MSRQAPQMPSDVLYIRVSRELHKRLRHLAIEDDSSVTSLVLTAIEEWLDRRDADAAARMRRFVSEQARELGLKDDDDGTTKPDAG